MHNKIRRRARGAAAGRFGVIKSIALLFFLCLFIKIIAAAGADSAAQGLMLRLAQDDNIVGGILRFELGAHGDNSHTGLSALLSGDAGHQDSQPFGFSDSGTGGDGVYSPTPDAPDSDHRGALFYGGEPPVEEDDAPYNTTPPLVSAADGVEIRNSTDYALDAQALIREPLSISLAQGEPAVLIIHTHSSEAYTPDGGDVYEASDPYRTENRQMNITRVGDELTAALEARGIAVIHDRNSYDYPSYSGSYSRSYDAISSYLERYPSIKLVIDLHRDAISAPDGSQYKTLAQIDGVTCSQVMLVVGTDYAGLEHPFWRENLKLALHLQQEMNALSPSLTRPIHVAEYRYNQQATRGSLIVEIGCAGNTLQESLTAAGFFAEAAANVILGLYK